MNAVRDQSHGIEAVLMPSKTYRAKTMKEALTRVRRDLGGDALILSAREVRRRRLFGLGPKAVVEVVATDTLPSELEVSAAGPTWRDRSPAERRRACSRGSANSLAGCTRWSRP